MEAVASTELDDAIFPQPPQDEGGIESATQEIVLNEDVSQQNWEDEKSGEVEEDDNAEEVAEEDKSKKKEGDKKKSRIRRLFTGIRLKKEESGTSSEDDDTESELTLDSREASATGMEEGALVNKTAFTRIIHRVQTKANRMWEQIGQKLGGRADSDEDDMTEESSKSLSLVLSEVKEGGDAPGQKGSDSEPSSEEVRKDPQLGAKGSPPDLSAEDSTGSKGKSGTLRRIASGLKSGLIPSKQKNKK